MFPGCPAQKFHGPRLPGFPPPGEKLPDDEIIKRILQFESTEYEEIAMYNGSGYVNSLTRVQVRIMLARGWDIPIVPEGKDMEPDAESECRGIVTPPPQAKEEPQEEPEEPKKKGPGRSTRRKMKKKMKMKMAVLEAAGVSTETDLDSMD